jgi:hypothetical protein
VQHRGLSREELVFLVAIPLAWAVLLLFHPGGEGDTIYADIEDKVTTWMVVHIGTLVFIPLMAVILWVLLRGIEGTAAWVSRVAVLFFAVFYGAFETLQGIANGILANEVNGLPETEQAIGSELIQDFAESPLARDFGALAIPGTLGLVVATIAAGVALRREAGATLPAAVLIGISGFLITAHPPPFGPTGLVLFVIGVVLFARGESSAPPAAPAVGR